MYVLVLKNILSGLLVKWLTHRPLKATFTGSNPVQVTINNNYWNYFQVRYILSARNMADILTNKEKK